MSALITPEIDTPPPRNLTKELDAISKAYFTNAPKFYNLEAQYGPQYNRLDIAKLAESVRGFDDEGGFHTPGSLELGREASQFSREADISDVEGLGGRATEAYLNANPWLRRSLMLLEDRSQDSDLLSALNTGAEDALASGGQLSAQEQRDIDQQSRAAFADRGMLHGSPSVGAELLQRDAAVRARQSAAQQFAAQVEGLNRGQSGVVADAARINASALADPFAAILGRSSGAGATMGALGQPAPRVYNPLDIGAYGQDLFNTNYNAGVNIGIAQSNADAATRAAIASIAGAGIAASDLRLKDNIVRVGTSPSGIPIVEFNYNTLALALDPALDLTRRWRGVIAQEVEKIKPDAISTNASGYLFVDYEMIDVTLEVVPDANAPEPPTHRVEYNPQPC